MPPLKTFIYVDGFNLYYRALKHTPYKWLNIKELCVLALGRRYRVDKIKYYTARVSDKVDSDQPRRQQVYLRALRTIPEVQIHYGKFLVHPVRLPLQTPLPDGTRSVWVMRTEEKGSDVNLASHLVHDAHKGAFEAAAVVSCDTDLVEPLRIVSQEIGLPVCLLPPQIEGSKSLKAVANEVRKIGTARLKQAQFSDVVTSAGGEIRKPGSW
jgi:uncharacterized LabA/DUF88 family protein